MSGKLVAALVAAAVSSASAATVGIVYTKLAPHMSSGHAGGDETSGLKSAVVLNATETVLDSFAESGVDGDAPACPNRDDARRCIVVARASDIKLNILGYTVSIPPIWLGGDSEDRYASADNAFFAPLDPLGEFGLVNRRQFNWEYLGLNKHENSGGQSSSDSQNQSTTSSSTPASPSISNDVTPTVVSDPTSSFAALDNVVDDASALTSDLALPGSLGSSDPPTVPEPSTWLMMLLGVGFLGLIKRRRIAALIKPAAN